MLCKRGWNLCWISCLSSIGNVISVLLSGGVYMRLWTKPTGLHDRCEAITCTSDIFSIRSSGIYLKEFVSESNIFYQYYAFIHLWASCSMCWMLVAANPRLQSVKATPPPTIVSTVLIIWLWPIRHKTDWHWPYGSTHQAQQRSDHVPVRADL